MPRPGKNHNLRGTPEYNSWMNAKARCHNENHPRYKDWGGKGIKVCDEWLYDFERFYRDMGPRPDPSYSLDRKDGTKGYCKENCRWASKKEQSVNRPSWVNEISFNGQTKTITDWAIELGISRRSLYERLQKWPIERALSERKNH